MHMSQSQEFNIRLAPFNVLPRDPLMEFFFPSPHDSAKLDVLVIGMQCERTLPLKDV